MRRTTNIAPSTLATAILFSLLTACGGGGGGMVRSPAPAAPLPAPPAPPPAPTGACPMPITGNCVVTLGTVTYMAGGRSSPNALVLEPSAFLGLGYNPNGGKDLAPGTYIFSGGTHIGTKAHLGVYFGNTLQSNVLIDDAGSMNIAGVARGDVLNAGSLWLNGEIVGNVANHGVLAIQAGSPTNTGWPISNRIAGNFLQSTGGTLRIALPTTAAIADYRYTMNVTGRADLSGTLSLDGPNDGWDSYPFPTTPTTAHLLHADGGVFGTFDRWISPGLFITGALRYGSNDLWFDLTSISILSGATTSGLGSGITLASAANFDRALAGANGFAGPTTASQQAFLASAGKLVWMTDGAQATRALDSLSGAIHADALQSTGDAASTRNGLGAHLDRVEPGARLGAWMHEDGSSVTSGVDQWLSPRLLAGVHASQAARLDAASASATDLASGGYLRWVGNDGWYAGLDAGITHRTLVAGRAIDFGNSGQWLARSRRSMDAVSASIEAGKRLPMLGGSLTPFVGTGVGSVTAAAATEQGTSGFELQLADAQLRGSRASAGLRFARHWQWGDARWLQLNAATGIDHSHWDGQQQAAFLGVPDAWFDLPASNSGRQRWASLGLQGGWGNGWIWNAARTTGRTFGSDQAWQLALERRW